MTAATREAIQVDAATVYLSLERLGCDLSRLGLGITRLSKGIDRVEAKLDRLELVMFAMTTVNGAATIAILVKLFLE